MDVSGLKLFEGKVFVIWKWYSSADTDEDLENVDMCDEDDDVDGIDEAGSIGSDHETVHSITFKCIGSAKEHRYQEVLAEAALKKRNGENVEVRIHPEPQNPYDARAIAFECLIGTKWERVGYMVSEVLDSVHQVLQDNALVSVRLDWVKFITHWSSSGPGWYCGVEVSRKGSWSKEILQSRSTI